MSQFATVQLVDVFLNNNGALLIGISMSGFYYTSVCIVEINSNWFWSLILDNPNISFLIAQSFHLPY